MIYNDKKYILVVGNTSHNDQTYPYRMRCICLTK